MPVTVERKSATMQKLFQEVQHLFAALAAIVHKNLIGSLVKSQQEKWISFFLKSSNTIAALQLRSWDIKVVIRRVSEKK